jgi:hypothetical protein
MEGLMNQNDLDETEAEDLFGKAVEFRDLIEHWFAGIARTMPRDRITLDPSAVKGVKIYCSVSERSV